MSAFSGGFEHYAPWKTIDGREVVTNLPALEVLIKGVFDQRRFLDILRTSSSSGPTKSGRVRRSSSGWRSTTSTGRSTRRSSPPSTASGPDGDRRGGVVWHTQGSGKSFEMLFYAAKVMRDPRMSNPTLVFITDRNDLDDQLFGEVFAPARILPETPGPGRDPRRAAPDARAAPRAGSSSRRSRSSRPERTATRNPVLTDRRNVVVVADEAHRSQYDFEKLDRRGSSRRAWRSTCAMRCRTPPTSASPARRSRSTDKSTRAVFGDYIDVYDLTRAVEDGATVQIFYESRLAKVELCPRGLRGARRTRRRDHREGRGVRGRRRPRPAGRGSRPSSAPSSAST